MVSAVPSYPFAPPPNATDYLTFLRAVVGVAPACLPDDSPFIDSTLAVAQEIVNGALASGAPQIYTLAVYNLAADELINFAPDQVEQNFFQSLRKAFNITQASVGVVSSASDNGTSSTLLNPVQMQAFTLANLQNMKTPYGRQYLAFAQSYGQTLWGLN